MTKTNMIGIVDYLKKYGLEIISRDDNSKVLYFKNKDVDELKKENPEKNYYLAVHPIFDKKNITYGQLYCFVGILPDVNGTFTSPIYSNLTIDVALESTAIVFEKDFKKILDTMVGKG